MKLSVALCTYNGQSFIEQQIRSILNQTMSVDEIVICDDMSSDNTIAILRQLEKVSSIPIKIHINNINLGVCKNFQQAISFCSGDIIFLSDQDDLWESDKVENIVCWFADNPQKKVVFTNASLIDENNNFFSSKSLFDCVGLNKNALKTIECGYGLELFCFENRVTGATMAIMKGFEWNADDCSSMILHDEIIALTALQNNELGYIDKKLMHYRIHRYQTQGLLQWIEHPIEGNFLVPSSYSKRYFSIKLNRKTRDRIYFNNWRSCLKCSLVGPVKSLCRWNDYKKYYGSSSSAFFRFDIMTSVRHTILRIKTKIADCCNA